MSPLAERGELILTLYFCWSKTRLIYKAMAIVTNTLFTPKLKHV